MDHQPLIEEIPPREPSWLKRSRIFLEILKLVVIAVVIITPIRLFVAQPFIVSGRSMQPTFEVGEYLVIDKLSYRFSEIQRGEVLIFRYPLNQDEFYVKRVVGLPGEQIQISGNNIAFLSADGETYDILNEPYAVIASSTEPLEGIVQKEAYAVTLDDDEYFMMGDNRSFSSDSRVWGALRKKYIVGRAAARLLPFSHFNISPGVYTFPLGSEPVSAIPILKSQESF